MGTASNAGQKNFAPKILRGRINLRPMSKIEAYICDCCGSIVPEAEAVGIIPTEDAFDRMFSYPVEMSPRKTNIHHCIKCYREKVLNMAIKQVRRRIEGEEVYKAKIKELHYGLRSQAVKNYFSKKLVSLRKR
jgi:hypothetical protein